MIPTVAYNFALSNLRIIKEIIRDEQPSRNLAIIDKQIEIISHYPHRVPLSIVAKYSEELSYFYNEPLLGLKIISKLDISKLPFISILHRHLTTPHIDGISLYLKAYFSSMTEVVSIDHQISENYLTLTLNRCDSYVSRHQIEGTTIGIIRVLHYLTKIRPWRIEFDFKDYLDNPEQHLEFWNVMPEFEHDSIKIIYRCRSNLGVNDKNTVQAVQQLNSDFNHEFPDRNVRQLCEKVLYTILHLGSPNREWVAAILNMSVSSLHRKLKEENTTFLEILFRVRKKRVPELLTHNNINTAQLSQWLGYRSESHFFKSFKSLFNMTPGEFKKSTNRQ